MTYVMSVTGTAIGCSNNRQPDWFAESTETLIPLAKASQRRMLKTNSTAGCKACQRAMKAADDEVKEKWICRIASDAEKP